MATIGGHILTGSRLLGVSGDLAGHVITGSARLRGFTPLIGHVITGAGHFIEICGYTVQEIPVAYGRFEAIYDQWVNNVRTNLARPMLIPTQVPTDLMLAPAAPRTIVRLGNVESSAWDAYMERGGQGTLDSLKELGLSLGSAFSGDVQGAIEHGMAFIEQNQQDLRHMRDVLAERAAGRSGEGIVRDMGMIRHAGD